MVEVFFFFFIFFKECSSTSESWFKCRLWMPLGHPIELRNEAREVAVAVAVGGSSVTSQVSCKWGMLRSTYGTCEWELMIDRLPSLVALHWLPKQIKLSALPRTRLSGNVKCV